MYEAAGHRKLITTLQALEKARNWCAAQERCHSEARSKLFDWGIHDEEAEQIIAQLIAEGFLNEERFARAYARGKFRIKHWGRNKILQGLKFRKISPYCIRKGLEEIDEEEYRQTLRQLFEKRCRDVKERNPWTRKAKILSFLVAKGYEAELVRGLLNENGHADETD